MILNDYLNAFRDEDEPFVFYYTFDQNRNITRTQLTRGEFRQKADQAALILKKHGLDQGDCFTNCFGGNTYLDLVFRLAATMRAVTPVTVNWQADTIDRIIYKIKLTDSKLILTDNQFDREQLAAIQERLPHLPVYNVNELESVSEAVKEESISFFDPLHTRVTVFTSGTTGQPKGVKLTYQSYETNRATFEQFIDIHPEDKFAVLIINPLHHGNSTSITDWAMRRPGTHIHLVERYATSYWQILHEAVNYNYDRLLAPTVSRHFDFLENLDREGQLPVPLEQLKKSLEKVDFLVGSAPVGPTTIQRLLKYAGRIPYVRFGATETCLQTIGTPGHFSDEQKISLFEKGWNYQAGDQPQTGYYIGRPHPPFTEARIVRSITHGENGFMIDSDVGQPGYAVTRGKNLMSGYVKNPEATAEVFAGEWYLGLKDICFTLKNEFDGELDYYWISRDSMMLIRGGANYAYDQINAELTDFVSEYYQLPKEIFEIAVVGLKVETEHEDACCVTIEPLKDEVTSKLGDNPETFLKAAAQHVSKGAKPDYMRFGKIPRSFKGAVLMKELTEDYIQWIVEDSEATSDDVGGRCMLFITYYKLADNVPHIPEECYAGGGFQKTEDGGVTFTIGQGSSGGAGDGSLVRKIGGNYLVFSNSGVGDWQSNREVSVLYLFRVNGSYAGGREEARLVMKGNLFRKSSYFCKVEIVFNQCESIPSKEDAVAISEKLLGVVLPVLEEEHWPDLEK